MSRSLSTESDKMNNIRPKLDGGLLKKIITTTKLISDDENDDDEESVLLGPANDDTLIINPNINQSENNNENVETINHTNNEKMSSNEHLVGSPQNNTSLISDNNIDDTVIINQPSVEINNSNKKVEVCLRCCSSMSVDYASNRQNSALKNGYNKLGSRNNVTGSMKKPSISSGRRKKFGLLEDIIEGVEDDNSEFCLKCSQIESMSRKSSTDNDLQRSQCQEDEGSGGDDVAVVHEKWLLDSIQFYCVQPFRNYTIAAVEQMRLKL